MKTVGSAIRMVRMQRGLKCLQLAERSHLHRNVISRIEHGQNSLALSTFCDIASGLDVSAWRLLRYAEELANREAK